MNAKQVISELFGSKTEAAPLPQTAPAPAPQNVTEAAPLTLDILMNVLAANNAQLIAQFANLTAPAPAPQTAPAQDGSGAAQVVNAAPQTAPAQDGPQLTEKQTARLKAEAGKGAKFIGWLPRHDGPGPDYPVFQVQPKGGPPSGFVRFVRESGAAPVVPLAVRPTIKTEAAPAQDGSGAAQVVNAAPQTAPAPQTEAAPAPVVLSGAAPVAVTFTCKQSHKRRDKLNLAAAYSVQLVNTVDGQIADVSNGKAIAAPVAQWLTTNVIGPGIYSGYVAVEPDRSMLWIYCGAAHERPLFTLNSPVDTKMKAVANHLNAANNR